MAESVREQALDQIKTLLAGMTGTRFWGGAYANAPTVERIFKTPVQVNQFPHLCVIEDSGSTFTPSAFAGRWDHRFRVVLYGWVQGDDLTTRSTWLQRLQQDVRRTLVPQDTLGGLAVRIEWAEEETDEGAMEPIGAFAQGLAVELHESVT